jgi:biopolymer transport protein ExbD
MAGKMSRAGGDEGITDINITPFVDIALVLLIIFMISTPALVYKGMRVSLPKVDKAEDITHVTLRISMDDAGKLTLDNRPVTVEELKRIYEGLRENRAAVDAIIAADRKVMHGEVLSIVDALRSIGVEQVGFGVLPKIGGRF